MHTFAHRNCGQEITWFEMNYLVDFVCVQHQVGNFHDKGVSAEFDGAEHSRSRVISEGAPRRMGGPQ